MSVIIPLRDDLPYYDLVVQLDGVSYTLEFKWNVRIQRWFMRVLNEGGDTVVLGDTMVVANFPLYPYDTGRAPPGIFIAIDTTGVGIDPGLNDLGKRVQLEYLTAADLGL